VILKSKFPKKNWEHFKLDSGFGVKGSGTTKREAFENAAMGAMSIIIDPNKIRGLNSLFIDCESEKDEDLLEKWINSLIKEMEERKMLFSKFQVYLEKPKLRGKVWGEPIDSRRHKSLTKLLKAQKEERFVAQVSPHEWVAKCGISVA
jgi:SHS2 domain-containing protein